MAGDLATGRVNETYDDKNDYRYRMWESTVENNREVTYFIKYMDETRTGSGGLSLYGSADSDERIVLDCGRM